MAIADSIYIVQCAYGGWQHVFLSAFIAEAPKPRLTKLKMIRYIVAFSLLLIAVFVPVIGCWVYSLGLSGINAEGLTLSCIFLVLWFVGVAAAVAFGDSK